MHNNPVYKILKKGFKGLLHGVGYDVLSHNIFTSQDIQLQTLLNNFSINTILDVGANEGQFALKLLDLNYRGNIYSFEPISAVFKKLVQNTQAHKKWNAIQAGIGSVEGELMLNVSENLASSSLLDVGSRSIGVEPATRTTRQEKIAVTTIDAFTKGHPDLQTNIMLKLDVQGFELEALRGAMQSMSKFDVIQVELSFIPLYVGGPLYVDVIAFLEAHGFEFFTFFPAFVDGKTGRMLQADGIFVRKTVGQGQASK